MALLVQKFGGTSVGDLDRISSVASLVGRTIDEGHQVVVVVSAMAGETDKLVGLAHQLAEVPNQREMDYLLSSGERVTQLAAGHRPERRWSCRAVVHRAPRRNPERPGTHTSARIRTVVADEIVDALKKDRVPVVAGFQGVDDNRDVTTLGRGGSDLTAVALAAALKADRCQILTDVSGVFTADPRIVPEARKIPRALL